MVQRLNINSEILSAYIHQSNTPVELLRNKFPKIDKFLSGESRPTFNQLVDIAKVINVPVGLLVLKRQIPFSDMSIDFRTLGSQKISEMSSELRDTILEMQGKQDFLREYIEDECSFVGLFDFDADETVVLSTVQTYLGNKITRNRFEYYRKLLGNLGVFVFLNGKYKDNTRRPLNLNEFRGFVLSDKKAPIIFINQLDTKTGRLFTLIHEFVHLFYGSSSLLVDEKSISRNNIEKVINSITAEILVPKELVFELFNFEYSIQENLETIAKKCEVSEFVVIRRILDLHLISKSLYKNIYKDLEEKFKKLSKNVKKSSGGDYNKNLRYRMDDKFVKHVNNALKQSKISYTDAFSLVGVNYKNYKFLVGEGG